MKKLLLLGFLNFGIIFANADSVDNSNNSNHVIIVHDHADKAKPTKPISVKSAKTPKKHIIKSTKKSLNKNNHKKTIIKHKNKQAIKYS